MLTDTRLLVFLCGLIHKYQLHVDFKAAKPTYMQCEANFALIWTLTFVHWCQHSRRTGQYEASKCQNSDFIVRYFRTYCFCLEIILCALRTTTRYASSLIHCWAWCFQLVTYQWAVISSSLSNAQHVVHLLPLFLTFKLHIMREENG